MNKNNEIINVNKCDTYLIKQGSNSAKTSYVISVDFEKESLSGACFYNGALNHMVDNEKCIELLEDILVYSKPQRDFTAILDKCKKN